LLCEKSLALGDFRLQKMFLPQVSGITRTLDPADGAVRDCAEYSQYSSRHMYRSYFRSWRSLSQSWWRVSVPDVLLTRKIVFKNVGQMCYYKHGKFDLLSLKTKSCGNPPKNCLSQAQSRFESECR